MSNHPKKHTISKAGLIYAGDVNTPGLQQGIIGVPLGCAEVRFAFEGVTPGAAVATLTTASPVGTRIPVMQDVSFPERDYVSTMLAPVLNIASAGNDTGKTLTIRGTDGAGFLITRQVALGNVSSVATPVGFAKVDHVELSAAPAGNVTITTLAKYSFPFAVWDAAGQVGPVFVDTTEVASPSYTTARTADDTASGADARGLLDLTGESVSDSIIHFSQYVRRNSEELAIGKTPWTDRPTYYFVR